MPQLWIPFFTLQAAESARVEGNGYCRGNLGLELRLCLLPHRDSRNHAGCNFSKRHGFSPRSHRPLLRFPAVLLTLTLPIRELVWTYKNSGQQLGGMTDLTSGCDELHNGFQGEPAAIPEGWKRLIFIDLAAVPQTERGCLKTSRLDGFPPEQDGDLLLEFVDMFLEMGSDEGQVLLALLECFQFRNSLRQSGNLCFNFLDIHLGGSQWEEGAQSRLQIYRSC